MHASKIIAAAMTVALLALIAAPVLGLSFNFATSGKISPDAMNGFSSAAQMWSSRFVDDVTVNINIGFKKLGRGILGQTGTTEYLYNYSSVYGAMQSDGTSADDLTAVGSLQAGSSFNLLINRTSNSPYGRGSATPYLDNDGDANNTSIRMTTANAKALGLLLGSGTTSDASITLSNAYKWDFDPSNGITPGTLDFVGIVAHELGHALGFISGVDVLDANSSRRFYPDDAFTFVSVLDLFRFSTQSVGYGSGTIDWTADARDKYFSIDGGASNLGLFATGERWGDGDQASHWKDDLGLGIMDPTAAYGELMSISGLDVRALDVIGWNLYSGGSGFYGATYAADGSVVWSAMEAEDGEIVPEPATIMMIAFGALAAAAAARRRLR